MTKLHVKAEQALGIIRTAVGVRAEITEHYRQYKALTDIAEQATGVPHADVKKAVDAIHYLGGGYPSPNSKGRMEALLDGFAGMYKVLEFIGSGHLVIEHLAQYGITATIADEHKLKDRELTPNELKYLDQEYSSAYFHLTEVRTTRQLVTAIVEECNALQTTICQKADVIKDELRPSAQATLEIEDAEYDRLHDFVKFQAEAKVDKAQNKRIKINTSLSGLNAGLAQIGTIHANE